MPCFEEENCQKSYFHFLIFTVLTQHHGNSFCNLIFSNVKLEMNPNSDKTTEYKKSCV